MSNATRHFFSLPSVTGHSGGDPISKKKLDKLERFCENVKEVLRWVINGANFTISLPLEKIKISKLTSSKSFNGKR